jgi:integrase
MKNYRVNHGYGEARVMFRGDLYNEHCGPDCGEFSCKHPKCRDSRSHAEEWLALIKKQIRDGKLNRSSVAVPLPFDEAADLYYKKHFLENPHRTEESKKHTRYLINIQKDYWGSKPLHEFRKRDGDQYWIDNQKPYYICYACHTRDGQSGTCPKCGKQKTEKIKAPSSVNRELATLASIFECFINWVRGEDISPVLLPRTVDTGEVFNPIALVHREPTDDRKRQRVASREEIKRLKTWCVVNDPALFEAIKTAIITNLRKGDQVRLVASPQINMRQGKTRRPIRLPVALKKPLNFINFRRRWNAARQACDMMDFHWHDWRHTGATMLAEMEVALEVIQEILGHATPKQTKDYINLGGKNLKPALDRLEREIDAI